MNIGYVGRAARPSGRAKLEITFRYGVKVKC